MDKFIVERSPWKLAGRGRLLGFKASWIPHSSRSAAEALRIITALLSPVIPESAAKIWSQLGFTQPVTEVRTRGSALGTFESRPDVHSGAVSALVFPRADPKASIDKMRDLEVQEFDRQQACYSGKPPHPLR